MDSSHSLPEHVQDRLYELLDGGCGPDSPELGELRRANPEHVDAIESVVLHYQRTETAAATAPLPADAAPPSAAPEVLGSYRLLEVLGEGGMGIVYRAVDERLGRQVALKRVRAPWSGDAAARQRFAREARAISRLDHPNVCRLYEYGEVEGCPYFAMQLVDGEPLDRLVARAALRQTPLFPATDVRASNDRAVELIRKVTDAVHAMHQRGFVHRDLKPANIMIDRRGEPVVLDFGLVRDEHAEAEGLTLTDMVVGTPAYMAPEQIEARAGRVGPHTDTYALGAVLFELLALRPAFTAASLHDLQKRILRGERPSLRRSAAAIPADLERVVAHAMDVSPERRYPTAAAFAEDLRRVLAREPIAARPPSVVVRAQRWMQRNPVGATLLAALALGLFLTLQLLWTAESARAATRRHLDRFTSLAAVERLRAAEAEAAQLFPTWPHTVATMQAWLDRHEQPLADDLAAVRAVLRDLEQAGSDPDPDFDPASREFLRTTLAELVPGLERFLRSDGTVGDVRARIAAADAIRDRSIDAHQDRWREAIAAIRASEAYGGLEIAPQIGLVPLGMDPESKLWEFYHLRSAATGRLPLGEAVGGRPRVDPATGLVFVLLPGGSFAMGASPTTGPNRDPGAEVDEAPVRQIRLDPFFMSKYELTQGQWARLAADGRLAAHNPGMNRIIAEQYGEGVLPPITLANPMESVTWQDCAEVARRYGLELPTEAQWEYACRAGASTVFCWGDDPEPCPLYANVADATIRRFSAYAGEAWNDGHLVHAAVGSFAANGFGLHDVHGNVNEFCRDWKLPYTVEPAAGDGLRLPPAAGPRPDDVVFRGGAYELLLPEQRCANRQHMPPDTTTSLTGWRPSRRLFAAGEAGAAAIASPR